MGQVGCDVQRLASPQRCSMFGEFADAGFIPCTSSTSRQNLFDMNVGCKVEPEHKAPSWTRAREVPSCEGGHLRAAVKEGVPLILKRPKQHCSRRNRWKAQSGNQDRQDRHTGAFWPARPRPPSRGPGCRRGRGRRRRIRRRIRETKKGRTSVKGLREGVLQPRKGTKRIQATSLLEPTLGHPGTRACDLCKCGWGNRFFPIPAENVCQGQLGDTAVAAVGGSWLHCFSGVHAVSSPARKAPVLSESMIHVIHVSQLHAATSCWPGLRL